MFLFCVVPAHSMKEMNIKVFPQENRNPYPAGDTQTHSIWPKIPGTNPAIGFQYSSNFSIFPIYGVIQNFQLSLPHPQAVPPCSVTM